LEEKQNLIDQSSRNKCVVQSQMTEAKMNFAKEQPIFSEVCWASWMSANPESQNALSAMAGFLLNKKHYA